MQPSPYQISAFSHVARERSFSRAAKLLGVTQSSLTQHVGKLETTMQTKLFIRRRDGLELTAAGRDLFEVSDRWTTLDQIIRERVENYTNLTSGSLRITATATRPAMPIIASFKRQFPNVGIDFSLKSWTENMELVSNREIDIAIVTNPAPSPSLKLIDIRTTRYLAYLTVNHPLAARSSLSLRDLAEETVILPEEHSLTQRIVRRITKGLDLELSRTVKVSTFAAIKEAVLHGVGIGILLEDSLFPSDRLTAIPIDEMFETYTDSLVLPAEKSKLKIVERFVELASDIE